MPIKSISFAPSSSPRPPSTDGSFDTDDAMSEFGGSTYTKNTNISNGSSAERRRKNGGIDPMKHPKLAQKEQRAVACSKFTMIFVLLLAVTSMATATYLLISRDEQNDFEVQVCPMSNVCFLFLPCGSLLFEVSCVFQPLD